VVGGCEFEWKSLRGFNWCCRRSTHCPPPSLAAHRDPASIAATTTTALTVTEASELEALIPLGASVDALLLAARPPTNVVSWGPRPSEGSPYDQLVLHTVSGWAEEVARGHRPSALHICAPPLVM